MLQGRHFASFFFFDYKEMPQPSPLLCLFLLLLFDNNTLYIRRGLLHAQSEIIQDFYFWPRHGYLFSLWFFSSCWSWRLGSVVWRSLLLLTLCSDDLTTRYWFFIFWFRCDTYIFHCFHRLLKEWLFAVGIFDSLRLCFLPLPVPTHDSIWGRYFRRV